MDLGIDGTYRSMGYRRTEFIPLFARGIRNEFRSTLDVPDDCDTQPNCGESGYRSVNFDYRQSPDREKADQ